MSKYYRSRHLRRERGSALKRIFSTRTLTLVLILSLLGNAALLLGHNHRTQRLRWLRAAEFRILVGHTIASVDEDNPANLRLLLAGYQSHTAYWRVAGLRLGPVTERVFSEYEYILKYLATKETAEPEQVSARLNEAFAYLNAALEPGPYRLNAGRLEAMMTAAAPALGEVEELLGLHNNLGRDGIIPGL